MSDVVWYSRSRVMDLNADGRPDSAKIVAVGTRPDSLKILLRLIVNGVEAHREEWNSDYELIDRDPAELVRPRVDTLMRRQLSAVLAKIRVTPFDSAPNEMADDPRLPDKLKPRPRTQLLVSYGYETTMVLLWDAERKRFANYWSCC